MWLGLHGLQLVGYVIFGLIVVGGGVFLLFALGIKAMGSALSKALDHDPSKCALPNCVSCMERRRKAWEKRTMTKQNHAEASMMLPHEESGFTSTTDLHVGDGVSLANSTFRVTDIKTDIKGYMIALRNLQTKREIIVTVKFMNADRKIWHVLRRWGP